MPLSHTSPASHSSTSEGHRGCQRTRLGGLGFLLLFSHFYAWPGAPELRPAALRSTGITLLLGGTWCPGDQAGAARVPRPGVMLKSLPSLSPCPSRFHCCSHPSLTCHGSLFPRWINSLSLSFPLSPAHEVKELDPPPGHTFLRPLWWSRLLPTP